MHDARYSDINASHFDRFIIDHTSRPITMHGNLPCMGVITMDLIYQGVNLTRELIYHAWEL